MAVISRQTSTRFDQSVKQTGLTRSQWTLIAAVAGNPGASQKSIAGLLQASEAATGRLIEKLCADGLLVRKQDENDRRSWLVDLTDAAQPLLARMSDLASDLEQELFAGLSEANLADFHKYLGMVYHNLSSTGSTENA
jgi:MarR family transcriptional regulator, transcriptional regulator for hemolysin